MGKQLAAVKIREEVFVKAFAESFRPAPSAIAAGYAASGAHVRASKLLNSKHIQDALRVRLRLTPEFQKLSPTYVLEGLQECAERCMQTRPARDASGKALGYFKFNPHGAIKAYELIGKNYDMFSPDVIVNINVDLAQQLSQARQRASELQKVKKEIKDVTDEINTLNPELLKERDKKAQNSSTNGKGFDGLV